MVRYAVIDTKFPREFVLLQGTGCRWRKCVFCDYHNDVSDNAFEVNRKVLEKVTGCHGVLDVINSGSATELDQRTIELIKKVVKEREIHTLWFEMHYMYREQLTEFAQQFDSVKVKFRCGVETFDTALRETWRKGIPGNVTAKDLAQWFKGVCLMCGTVGESKEHIIDDIAIAKQHFEYISVNLFNDNSTAVKADRELQQWFVNEVYPQVKDDPQIEVLISNTDLGVGGRAFRIES